MCAVYSKFRVCFVAVEFASLSLAISLLSFMQISRVSVRYCLVCFAESVFSEVPRVTSSVFVFLVNQFAELVFVLVLLLCLVEFCPESFVSSKSLYWLS